jgi:hypothetical protein
LGHKIGSQACQDNRKQCNLAQSVGATLLLDHNPMPRRLRLVRFNKISVQPIKQHPEGNILKKSKKLIFSILRIFNLFVKRKVQGWRFESEKNSPPIFRRF